MTSQAGFMLYADQYEPIAGMTLEQKGILLEAMFAYHAGQPYEISDPVVKMAFGFFKSGFDRAQQKYADVCAKRKDAINSRWNGKEAEAADTNEAKGKQTDTNDTNEYKPIQTIPYQELKQELKQEQENKNTTPLPPASGGSGADVSPAALDSKKDSSNPRAGNKARASPTAYSQAFLAFWQIYPRKTGKDAAWKAWRNRKGDLPAMDELAAIIERQCHSDQWQRDGGQYIPHPATWLNQGRWKDEQETRQETRLAYPEGW